jgi:hypothetical protein
MAAVCLVSPGRTNTLRVLARSGRLGDNQKGWDPKES